MWKYAKKAKKMSVRGQIIYICKKQKEEDFPFVIIFVNNKLPCIVVDNYFCKTWRAG